MPVKAKENAAWLSFPVMNDNYSGG